MSVKPPLDCRQAALFTFVDKYYIRHLCCSGVIWCMKCYSQMWCYRQNVIHRCGVIDKYVVLLGGSGSLQVFFIVSLYLCCRWISNFQVRECWDQNNLLNRSHCCVCSKPGPSFSHVICRCRLIYTHHQCFFFTSIRNPFLSWHLFNMINCRQMYYLICYASHEYIMDHV